MKRLSVPLGLLMALAIVTSSCNKNEAPPLEPIESYLTISFSHMVGNEPVKFDTIRYSNTFGNLYSVATLKYFVSDIVLKKKDGQELRLDAVHYVDAMDKATLSFDPQVKLPAGDYSSVAFVFGLSEENNTSGRFPNPPENNMEWPLPLGGGYHYMKLEGKVDNSGDIMNFQAHTGPTGGNDNSIEVILPNSGFTVEGSKVHLSIVMDINKWWENPNIIDLNTMTMVMGNQEVQQKLHDNGTDVFNLVIKQTN